MSKRSRSQRRAAAKANAQRLDAAQKTTQRLDGWVNPVGGQGVVGRDKRTAHGVGCPPTLGQQELEDLYHGNDLAYRICRDVAETMVRGWIDITIDAPEASDDEPQTTREALKPGESSEATAPNGDDSHVEQAKDLELTLQTLDAAAKLTEAVTRARLTGGARVLIGADDGATDLSAPLDLDRVRAVHYLTVLDRFELQVTKWVDDPLAEKFGEPELYALNTMTADGKARVGQRIHASRFLHFDGAPTTRYRKRQSNQGWADSIFVRLFEPLRSFGSMWDSADILMQDFAQAVIKIKDLADLFATKGPAAVKDRIETMEYARSVLRAMLLDAEYEDYERKQTPLTGLPELLDRVLYRVASAAEMPITRLFGMSPGGLNATGASDIRNWYDTIKAKQEADLRPQLEYLIKVLLRASQGPTQGKEPEAWSFTFRPLWQMTDQEKADLRNKQAQTDKIYIDAGTVSSGEIAMSRFGGESYSLETKLDWEARDALDHVENTRQELDPKARQEAEAAAMQAANGDKETPDEKATKGAA